MKTKIFNLLNSHKKLLIFTCIYILLSICAIYFVKNDAQMYSTTVVKVTSQKRSGKYTKRSQNQKREKYYIQTVKGIVQNGEFKGKSVTMKNSYSISRVKTEKYTKGDMVFAKVIKASDGGYVGKINGLKRDTAGVCVILLFIYAIIVVAGRKGILFIISSVLNVGLLYFGLDMYSKGTDIMNICYLLVLLFTAVSLICISGFSKSTLISFVSVILVVAATGVIYRVVELCAGSPDYIMMEYVSSPNDLNKLFFMEILMGCLGAVMDVAVSISETACEITDRNPELSFKEFKNSIRTLGQDVMGTMVNILFFSYFCGTVPMIIVQMTNKYKFTSICRFDLPFELMRFLTGSIGIVLTIPVTAFAAWLFIYHRRNNADGGVEEL